MATTTMKIEVESESCCVCGGSNSELVTPEEHDAVVPPMQVPLRTMLLQLNNNKVVPEGRYCTSCIRRAMEAFEFSTALSTRQAPPLSEKIRALRRRLHQLTQKIDVFIVVGGPGVNSAGAYSEDDIIMVEKDALAAAAAADDEDLERAKNARGDTVYQCSVCPLSFERVSEYRSHAASHGADARHSCWACGAQFAGREALRQHSATHRHAAACYLCDTSFRSESELRLHEAACPARCPLCAELCTDRGALAEHAQRRHGRGAEPPLLCAVCFRAFAQPELLTAHQLRHRQAKQFVCGLDTCILRFTTRENLMAHIRKCHSGEAQQSEEAIPSTTCQHCKRTFGSVAAMRRHARVHAREQREQEESTEYVMEAEDEIEGEVEYLEVEVLEDMQYREDDNDRKPELNQIC